MHRVVLTFDGGGLMAKLICPESGCVVAEFCGACGRHLADPETEPCYDCSDIDLRECWVKTWFDNCAPDELLHGSVTVEVECEWDGDVMVAQIARVIPESAA